MSRSSSSQDNIEAFNANLSRMLDTNRRILDFNITAARYSYSLINREYHGFLEAHRPVATQQRNNVPHIRTRITRRVNIQRPEMAERREQSDPLVHPRAPHDTNDTNDTNHTNHTNHTNDTNDTNDTNYTSRVRTRSYPDQNEQENPTTRRRLEVNIDEQTLNETNFDGNPLEMFLNFARILNQRNETDDTIENGMTPAQIREATTSGVYSDVREEMDETTDVESGRRPRCPISWSVFEEDTSVLKINGCGHIFSDGALTEWLRMRSTCPTCRYNLLQSNEEFRRRREGSSEPSPLGVNIPENAPLGIDINRDLNVLGFFANMIRGSPIDRSDVENLSGLGETFNINITNSNID